MENGMALTVVVIILAIFAGIIVFCSNSNYEKTEITKSTSSTWIPVIAIFGGIISGIAFLVNALVFAYVVLGFSIWAYISVIVAERTKTHFLWTFLFGVPGTIVALLIKLVDDKTQNETTLKNK